MHFDILVTISIYKLIDFYKDNYLNDHVFVYWDTWLTLVGRKN